MKFGLAKTNRRRTSHKLSVLTDGFEIHKLTAQEYIKHH